MFNFKIVAAFLAAAAAVNGLVTPKGLSQLDVTASTADSLTLAVNVALNVEATDAGRTIAFTFGNADGTVALGSGSLVIPEGTPAGDLTVAATGTYNPSTDAAHAAGEALLSAYASNLDSAVSVQSTDGNFNNVKLSAPGVEIVRKLFFWVDLNVIIRKSGNIQLELLNAFSLPLSFLSLTASAVTPLLATNTPTAFGQITQDPLPSPIVIPAKTVARSQNVTAAVTLTLAQGVNLIQRLANGAEIPVTSTAVAVIKLGDYQTKVTLNNKVIPGVQATA